MKQFKLNMDKEIQYFLKHMFKYHYDEDSHLSKYELKLLKCYYILQIQRNSNLTSFILIDMMMEKEDGMQKRKNFIEENIKQLHQYHFQNIIVTEFRQDNSVLKIDLEKMLKANQLMSNFDVSIDDVTEEIFTFWKYLITDKQS